MVTQDLVDDLIVFTGAATLALVILTVAAACDRSTKTDVLLQQGQQQEQNKRG